MTPKGRQHFTSTLQIVSLYFFNSWGRVTHICVSKLTIIVPEDNGLSPDRRQAIVWTNAGILLIRTLGTNFSEILSEIHTFPFKKMHLKTSSAKWRPFCIGFNVLIMTKFVWWWLFEVRMKQAITGSSTEIYSFIEGVALRGGGGGQKKCICIQMRHFWYLYLHLMTDEIVYLYFFIHLNFCKKIRWKLYSYIYEWHLLQTLLKFWFSYIFYVFDPDEVVFGLHVDLIICTCICFHKIFAFVFVFDRNKFSYLYLVKRIWP